MPDAGHIELERTIDSIVVGMRHRDPGDVEDLKRSIEQVGMLQPITISPDGVLLCGRRRLEAVKQLQWRTVRVWVRSGISDALSSVLALNHENVLHKPLTLLEAARLYREYKRLLAEDAARRQRATWFGPAPDVESDGGERGAGNLPAPSQPGRAREQAAILVSGVDSHTRLDRICELDELAHDDAQPDPLRTLAAGALGAIGEGAPVIPTARRVDDVRTTAGAPTSDDDLEELAREALSRIRRPRSRRASTQRPRSTWSLRSFALTWTDMDGWWNRYDPVEVGTLLKEDDWEHFERILHATNEFADVARIARAAHAAADLIPKESAVGSGC